jgi:hypothetical protein
VTDVLLFRMPNIDHLPLKISCGKSEASSWSWRKVIKRFEKEQKRETQQEKPMPNRQSQDDPQDQRLLFDHSQSVDTHE